MLFCKFATYFQNTYSYEHLWTAASKLNWGLLLILRLQFFEHRPYWNRCIALYHLLKSHYFTMMGHQYPSVNYSSLRKSYGFLSCDIKIIKKTKKNIIIPQIGLILVCVVYIYPNVQIWWLEPLLKKVKVFFLILVILEWWRHHWLSNYYELN